MQSLPDISDVPKSRCGVARLREISARAYGTARPSGLCRSVDFVDTSAVAHCCSGFGLIDHRIDAMGPSVRFGRCGQPPAHAVAAHDRPAVRPFKKPDFPHDDQLLQFMFADAALATILQYDTNRFHSSLRFLPLFRTRSGGGAVRGLSCRAGVRSPRRICFEKPGNFFLG